jgi:hypothetical protein
VSLFDEHPGHPPHPLPAGQVPALREVLDTHANDPSSGQCRICGRPSCPTWRDAYDQLATAGQLMAEPDRWGNIGGRQDGR